MAAVRLSLAQVEGDRCSFGGKRQRDRCNAPLVHVDDTGRKFRFGERSSRGRWQAGKSIGAQGQDVADTLQRRTPIESRCFPRQGRAGYGRGSAPPIAAYQTAAMRA
jgi:hypothetical protein